MKKIMVVYESRYGNTKLVAESIVEGMKEAAGVEPTLSSVRTVDTTLKPLLLLTLWPGNKGT